MQSRAIRRLARNLRSTHRLTKSWKETAKRHNITDKHGEPSKGLAYQIAHDGFEPREHETLIRIGMPCECDQCKKQKRQAKKLQVMTIFDMPSSQLLAALNNRQPMITNFSQSAMREFTKACKESSKARKVHP